MCYAYVCCNVHVLILGLQIYFCLYKRRTLNGNKEISRKCVSIGRYSIYIGIISQVPVNRGYICVNIMSSNSMNFFQY